MLRERVHPGDWLTLVSPRLEKLGVPHGFTTALGGRGLRWRVADAGDLRGLLAAQDLKGRAVVMGRQVHGAVVTTPGHRERQGCDLADAHVTSDAGELVAVRTADCVPILLSTGDGGTVAAVHAGWRGLEAGVIAAACLELAKHDDLKRCVAAIGPCIGVSAYEIGEEVAEHFARGVVRRDDWPRPHLDLRAIALEHLLEAGVCPDRIDVAAGCTFTDSDRFGSYRRDGKGCGHQAAFVGPTPNR